MTPADYDRRIKALESQVAQLGQRVRAQESPFGPVFIANRSDTNGAFFEVAANGTNLVEITGGRKVTTTNNATICLQKKLPLPQHVPTIAYRSGSNAVYFPLTPICEADETTDAKPASRTPETEDPTTWAPGDVDHPLRGVTLRVLTWVELGATDLWMYYRDLGFDACGNLNSVSAEAQVAVTTREEACP